MFLNLLIISHVKCLILLYVGTKQKRSAINLNNVKLCYKTTFEHCIRMFNNQIRIFMFSSINKINIYLWFLDL